MEEWKTFPPPFDGYKISNDGRIISPKGIELKPYAQKVGGGQKYTRIVCTLKIEKKGTYIRKMAGVATEVYRYFGKGYSDGVHVYHKDGDIMNNRIDNLTICRGYTEKPSAEQEARIPEIFGCVKHCMRLLGYTRYGRHGMDVDNVIGEAIFACWRHLPQFRTDLSFYAYCMRYVRQAFLTEYVKWKKSRTFESLDLLLVEI